MELRGFASEDEAMARGREVWSKKLSLTDAQRQHGNPTGDLRLVQAQNYNTRPIEQTTYFRDEVFGSLIWHAEKDEPFVEVAEVDFDITLMGTHYGNHILTVSHKPTGEAKQGNYTTNIRWGSFASILHSIDISDRILRLYAPTAGSTTPFFIVVE